ncbi:hypothetical protein HDU96_007434 [Phlyctochytrium bullatum]|nr:hypothetical protein HDU96_007434 [Phlyctochytrium bullatum]
MKHVPGRTFYDLSASSTAISLFVSTTFSFPDISSTVGIAAAPSFTEEFVTSISTAPPSAPSGGGNGTLIIAAGAVGGLVALTLATTAAMVLYRTCRPASAKSQFAESSALAAEQPGATKHLTGGGGGTHLDAGSTPVPPRGGGGGGNGGHMSHNPNGGRGEDAGGQSTQPGPGQITSHQPNAGPAWHGQPVPNGGGGGTSHTTLGPGIGTAPSSGGPTSYTSLPPGGAEGAGVAPGGGQASTTNTTPSYGPGAPSAHPGPWSSGTTTTPLPPASGMPGGNAGPPRPSAAPGPTGPPAGSWSATGMLPANPMGPLQPFLQATGPAASFGSGPVGAASGGPLIQSTPFAVVGPQHGRPGFAAAARGVPMVPDSESARQEAFQAYLYTGTHGTHPHQVAYYAFHPAAPGMQVAAHHPNAYAGGPPQQAYVTQPPPNGFLVYLQQPLPSTIVYSQPTLAQQRPEDSKSGFLFPVNNSPSPSMPRHEDLESMSNLSGSSESLQDSKRVFFPGHYIPAAAGTTAWTHPYEHPTPKPLMSPGQLTPWKLANAPSLADSAVSNATPTVASLASTAAPLWSDAAWASPGTAAARVAPARLSSLGHSKSDVTGEMVESERKA